jgi:hypothetical protein
MFGEHMACLNQTTALLNFAAVGSCCCPASARRETEQTFFVHQFLPISSQ